MPSDRFVVPSECPQCNAPTSIALQQVLKGNSVYLSWGCTRCDAEWPLSVVEPQFVERRLGLQDRRRVKRPDRRKA